MKVTLFLVENGQSNKAAMPNDWLSEVCWVLTIKNTIKKLFHSITKFSAVNQLLSEHTSILFGGSAWNHLVSRVMRMEVGGQWHPGWLSETVFRNSASAILQPRVAHKEETQITQMLTLYVPLCAYFCKLKVFTSKKKVYFVELFC